MNCIDCGQECEPAITPLCGPCAAIAVTILGSEAQRCALLGEEQ